MAQAFDAKRLEVTGKEVPIAEDVQINEDGKAAFGASENGYVSLSNRSRGRHPSLMWFDRTGKEMGQLGDRATYGDLDLFPGRQAAAVSILDSARQTRDMAGSTISRAA